MPTFDTPQPISVTLEFPVGEVRIVASKRTDTVVEVQPSNKSRGPDRQSAEQTRIEYTDGRLLVRAPKPPLWKQFGSRNQGSIELVIELPVGSRVHGEASMGSFRAEGRLGECRMQTSIGDIELEQTGELRLSSSMGDIRVEQVVGDVEIGVSVGAVRVGTVDGAAEIKLSSGDTRIGTVTGGLRAVAANGSIAVGRAGAGVTAKTSIGDIRISEIVRGTTIVESSVGEVEVGVGPGTAALLDLHTKIGSVHTALDSVEQPEPADETAEVRVRIGFGDITIRRYAKQHEGFEKAGAE